MSSAEHTSDSTTSSAPSTGEGASTSRTAWERRGTLAFAVRAIGVGGPIVAGMVAAIITSHVLPMPTSVLPMIVRTLVVVASSVLTIRLLDAVMRRMLPLATLMQLSLLFPDQAPSRLRIAIKSTSSRQMERLVAETKVVGLSNDLSKATEQVLLLCSALTNHDRKTRGHSERVRLYADMIGEEMKLSRDDRRRLQWGALLHDLGKLSVPVEILNKKDKLDDAEWAVMRNHPEAGRRMIGPLADFLGPWATAVWHHHERPDGTGYPYGISGSQIHIGASIVAVADSFEVMTAVRSYKKALSVREARAELVRCAGTQFSPEVVRAFMSVSVRRVRLAMGPLASIAHLPFLSEVAQTPARIAGVMSTGAAAATGATGPALVAGVMTVGALGGTGTLAAVAPVEPAPVVAAAAAAPAAATNAASPAAVAGSPTTAAKASGGARVNGATNTATTAPTTTTAARGNAPATTKAAAPTTAAPAPTSTAPAAPTSGPPPSTSPPTSAPPAPTIATGGSLLVSTSSSRTAPQLLQGSSFTRNSSIYVFVEASRPIDRVDFYLSNNANGGAVTSERAAPWDLMATAANGTANPWVLTSNGNKFVTAVIRYADNASPASETRTASFTVTKP